MSLNVGDIIEVKAIGTVFGEQFLNVFHYRAESFEANVDYSDIADVFSGFWTTVIAPLQTNDTVLLQTEVLNLTNGLDIEITGENIPGTVSAEEAPGFLAYGFQFIRSSRVTRHGWKRFCGVPEAAVIGNNLAAAWIPTVNAAAAVMENGLVRTGTVDEDMELVPVIVGRTLIGGSYEIDLSKINDVSSVAFVRITTQNSRKP